MNHSSRFCALLIICAFCAVPAFGNGSIRCDVAAPRIPGTELRDTLDVNRINGKTVNVPLSTTRIAADAFAFYKGNTSVDIVYVLDHSTSMQVDGYWESDDGKTVRYIRESEQLVRSDAHSFTDCGRRQISYGGGFSRLEVRKVCGAFHPILDELVSGDPFGSGSYAVREAIGEQARLAPHTRAAYLPFGVQDMAYAQQNLVTLNAAANTNSLFDKIDLSRNDFVGTTDYTEPLNLARQWLQGSDNPVIFFITDLQPTENGMAELTTYMANYDIPVYGVFIGLAEPTAVKDLFSRSGNGRGGFYHLRPEQSDSLRHVLKKFVGDLLAWAPASGSVVNHTNGRSAAASAASFSAQAGFTLMTTDKVVALDEGANEVTVRVVFRSTDGKEEVKQARFTINVGGMPEGAFRDDLLGLYCGPASAITINGQAGTRLSGVTEEQTITLNFSTALSMGASSADLRVTTAADNETVTISLAPAGAVLAGQAARPVTIGTQATAGNGSINAVDRDRITARWQHPNDPRDTALTAVNVLRGSFVEIAQAVTRDGRRGHADGCVDTVLLLLDQASAARYGGVDIDLVNRWKHLIRFSGDFAGLVVDTAIRHGDLMIKLVIAENPAQAASWRSYGEHTMEIDLPPGVTEGFFAWSPDNRIQDGIAPVLVNSAAFRLSLDESDPDTLVVTFSEPVSLSGATGSAPITPFAALHGTARYGLRLTVLKTEGTVFTFLVADAPYPMQGGSMDVSSLPAPGDSLTIFPGQVSQANGENIQTYADNRRVPLRISGPFQWQPVAVPNPFVAGGRTASPHGTITGTVITITTRTRIASVGTLQGRVIIYDAVGNVIMPNTPFVNDAAGTYLVWDGRNANGRLVGAGAYLAMVKIIRPDGVPETRRLMVGVRR